MEKEIRIFDDKNAVLKVSGIRFDLLDVGSGLLIDTQNSRDLNPPVPPTAAGSNEWGVKLNFSAQAGPVEVCTTDPNYRYPGNIIQSLEGQNDNTINIDLLRIPATVGGQGNTLTDTDPAVIASWVSASKWDRTERRAVLNLISNYMRLKAFGELAPKKEAIGKIVGEWRAVLHKLGIDIP